MPYLAPLELSRLRRGAAVRPAISLVSLICLLLFSTTSQLSAQPAKGTLTATGKVAAIMTVKHAYLVQGPELVWRQDRPAADLVRSRSKRAHQIVRHDVVRHPKA